MSKTAYLRRERASRNDSDQLATPIVVQPSALGRDDARCPEVCCPACPLSVIPGVVMLPLLSTTAPNHAVVSQAA